MRALTEADRERIERNRQAALCRRLARRAQAAEPSHKSSTPSWMGGGPSPVPPSSPSILLPTAADSATWRRPDHPQPLGASEVNLQTASTSDSSKSATPQGLRPGPSAHPWLPQGLPSPAAAQSFPRADSDQNAADDAGRLALLGAAQPPLGVLPHAPCRAPPGGSSRAASSGPPGSSQLAAPACGGDAAGSPPLAPACEEAEPKRGPISPALEARRERASLCWPPRQLFDYFVVIDFECTCDEGRDLAPQEIIEFPSVLVNARTLRVEDIWREFVRPAVHTTLTPFCTRLTGIQQWQVDAASPLADVVHAHDHWLRERGVLDAAFAVVTWSDWDCKVMLEMECKWKGIRKPPYFNRWVNLKVAFEACHLKRERGGLRGAVEAAGVPWEGRPHSGLDDARNTARLALALVARGAVLSITDSFRIYGPDGSRIVQPVLQQPHKTWLSHQKAPTGKKPVESSQPASGAGRRRRPPHPAAGGACPGDGGKCLCGVSSKRRSVKKPGPTHGRVFFSCGRWTITGGGACDYFEWAAPPAALPV